MNPRTPVGHSTESLASRLFLTTLGRQRNRITAAAPHPKAKYRPSASVRATAPVPHVHRCPCADCRNNAR